MELPKNFDYRNPDYVQIYDQRKETAYKLSQMAKAPDGKKHIKSLKAHYAANPWELVDDWGMTYEPRNAATGKAAHIPFILWPRQREFLMWLAEMYVARERALTEKSRDAGATWLVAAFLVSQWAFDDGFAAGVGSRKEDLVDKVGDPKTIFSKLRYFLNYLPKELRPRGYNEKLHSAHMRLVNPENGNTIVGEAGNQIGRGGRTSIYIVDEAAFLEQQEAVDSALSMTTDCQIDLSTVNGAGNSFYQKRMRWSGTKKIFIFDWRDDPRKDQAWYDKQCEDLDEVIVAQEIDRDYNAAQADSFIPAKWVNAAVDAHIRLGFEPEGIRATGFDPADTGDAKACVNRYGSVITEADQLETGDITDAVQWAYNLADDHRSDTFMYDADGMGAPVMKMQFAAKAAGRMRVIAYRGSAAVVRGEDLYGSPGKRYSDKKNRRLLKKGVVQQSDEGVMRRNKDMFENFRAQSWTWMRDRFEATYLAVERAKAGKIINVDPSTLISISSSCKKLHELVSELSRPRRQRTGTGKFKVESKKDMRRRGIPSPNLADGAIIVMSDSGEEPIPRQLRAGKKHTQPNRLEQYEPSVPGVM